MENITLESLIQTDGIDFNEPVEFESVMFEYSDVMIEGAELDVELCTVESALECAVSMEASNDVLSKIGATLKKVAKEILTFIARVVVLIRDVTIAPAVFIINLFNGVKFKDALKALKLDIQMDWEGVGDTMEWLLHNVPSEKTIERRRKLVQELLKLNAEIAAYAKTVFLTAQTNVNDFVRTYSDGGGNNQSTGTDPTFDEFEKRSKEFEKAYDDILAGKTFCASGQDVEQTFGVAKDAKLKDTLEKLKDCQNSLEMLEKLLDKDWNSLSESKQKTCVQILKRLKITIVQISVLEKEEAKDMKAIIEAIEKLSKANAELNNATKK